MTGLTSPDGPAMLHVRELHHLQLAAQDLLSQATTLAGWRVRPGWHEELRTLHSGQQRPLVLFHQTCQERVTRVPACSGLELS